MKPMTRPLRVINTPKRGIGEASDALGITAQERRISLSFPGLIWPYRAHHRESTEGEFKRVQSLV